MKTSLNAMSVGIEDSIIDDILENKALEVTPATGGAMFPRREGPYQNSSDTKKARRMNSHDDSSSRSSVTEGGAAQDYTGTVDGLQSRQGVPRYHNFCLYSIYVLVLLLVITLLFLAFSSLLRLVVALIFSGNVLIVHLSTDYAVLKYSLHLVKQSCYKSDFTIWKILTSREDKCMCVL